MFIVAFCPVQALGNYFLSGAGSGAVRYARSMFVADVILERDSNHYQTWSQSHHIGIMLLSMMPYFLR